MRKPAFCICQNKTVVDQLPRLGMRELICLLMFTCNCVVMPPTLKKLMGHIAFGAWVRACVRGSHFLYLL